MPTATQRAVDLLKLISIEPDGLTVSSAAEKLETSVATSSRLIQSLIDSDAVYRDGQTGRIKIATGMWSVGAAALRQVELRRVVISSVASALPDLGRLAHFGLPGRDSAISVERLDLIGNFVMSTPTGWAIPYHAGTIGKPILAFMPESERERILCHGLRRYTNSTITDRSVLEQELQQIRERGYANNRGEFAVDGYAVGVPIFGASGLPVGSLSTPATEQEMDNRGPVVRNLLNLGRSISLLLGHTPHPDRSFV